MKKSSLFLLLIILASSAIVVRLIPHPANFTPVAAIALFAGYYLPKKWAIILPLAVMLISDLFIGFYEWKLMLAVYGCLALAGIIGIIIRNRRNVVTVITSTLLISLSFFLITNLAVWLFSPWYAHDWPGLVLCYTLAVPFFRNTLMGNLFFVGILFGSYELVRAGLTKKVLIKTLIKTN
ncbi:hypothetical protein KJ840_03020 [Patescibacteria group bacterium]|nr:hypothetical protein [Patescibacteria group bacterium]